ncbi:MAG: hypothetical protein J7K83_02765, partial [Candidatus Aenigmarchaeota archaeon]|nr:hypothetical protein [Candidatus Aenigmarchaeota archaeon]
MKRKKKNNFDTKKLQVIILSVLLVANGIATSILLKNVKIPWVDEAIYVSMGKYIFSRGEYGYMDVFRAFGLPLLSGIAWLIGISPLIFLKYLSIFSWFFSAIVLYEIERKILKTGNMISLISFLFFLGFSIYYTRALTDSISMFFGLLGFYFLLRKDFFSSGFFFGFSGLIRYTGLTYFLVAIVAYFVNEILHKKQFHLKTFLKNVGVFTLMFSVMFLPNLLLSKAYFGSYLYMILSTFKNRYEQMWYGDANLLTHLGFVFLTPLAFSVFLILKKEMFNEQYSLAFIFVFILSLLFFSSPIMTKEKRYFMFVLP